VEQGLLDQGVTLMLVGMGTVFVFLTTLVIAMSLMSTLVNRLTPARVADGPSDEEVAAITAAIAAHRRKK
jgi:oxaloacetate decarboxylase gamma subunit